MRKYVFIALGGMLGAILRYTIKNIHIYNYNIVIPINTLLINVSGSFLLALILTISFEVYEFDADIRLGIATGFLGAYTTFSTLCKEAVNIMKQGHYYSSAAYIGLTIILGLMATYFGVVLGREIVSKISRNNNGSEEVDIENAKEGD